MSRFALGLTILFASACSSLPSELEPFDGTFDYAAFDGDGARVLVGRLELNVKDDGSITGSWEIGWVEGANQQTPVGPQVGTGSLVGAVADGDLSLNLNPQNSDDNVGLQGALDGVRIAGGWEYVTFAGPTGSGAFRATKR